VRFAVVIPRNDLDELRSHLKDLVPAVEPEKITREYPVLTVRHFWAIVYSKDKSGSEVVQWRDLRVKNHGETEAM
jgi:hypothetical protein